MENDFVSLPGFWTAKGSPLSERMAAGRPQSSNSRTKVLMRTLAEGILDRYGDLIKE